MLARFRRWFARRGQPSHIELNAEGFTVVGHDGGRHPIRWASVTKVAAYKRDLVTSDEIVLGFEVIEHPGVAVEISEEWPGFAELFGPMERQLGVSAAWYREIMLPAFDRGHRLLYERV